VTAPLALLLALSAAPVLECPAGTVLRGGAPPDEYEAWCEGHPDDAGRPRRHGPSRAWYDGGALHVEDHWAFGRRDGWFVEYHRNGLRARAGRYASDEKTGPWSTWSESGRLEEQVEYQRDLRHGPFTAWHPDGKKKTEGRFCLGQQCGAWISWDRAGKELGRMELGEQRAAP
jgi:hypothetical protein